MQVPLLSSINTLVDPAVAVRIVLAEVDLKLLLRPVDFPLIIALPEGQARLQLQILALEEVHVDERSDHAAEVGEVRSSVIQSEEEVERRQQHRNVLRFDREDEA